MRIIAREVRVVLLTMITFSMLHQLHVNKPILGGSETRTVHLGRSKLGPLYQESQLKGRDHLRSRYSCVVNAILGTAQQYK